MDWCYFFFNKLLKLKLPPLLAINKCILNKVLLKFKSKITTYFQQITAQTDSWSPCIWAMPHTSAYLLFRAEVQKCHIYIYIYFLTMFMFTVELTAFYAVKCLFLGGGGWTKQGSQQNLSGNFPGKILKIPWPNRYTTKSAFYFCKISSLMNFATPPLFPRPFGKFYMIFFF